jgi:hypothetical protein
LGSKTIVSGTSQPRIERAVGEMNRLALIFLVAELLQDGIG